MYGYVYKTTNLINGKIYIGQHKSASFSEDYKGSGKYLRRAIAKYGWENFLVELIESANSKQELNELEIKWIEKFNARDSSIGYNISKGGETWSYNWKGIPKSDLHKQHLSEANSGRCHTDEERKKMSEAHKGKQFTLEHRQHMSENFKKNYTDERRRKVSEANKRREYKPLSEEAKQKIRIAMQLRGGVTTGKVWVNNGTEQHLINPVDFEKYQSMGFNKGMMKGGKKDE